MKDIIEVKATHTDVLRIYCDFSNVCNYKCWYCFPNSNTGTHPWPDVDVIKENIVALVNHYNNSNIINKVELHLLGGEPTLWKDLGNFVKYVKENADCAIKILTNGSRTLRWWKKYANYFETIHITVHHEKVALDHIENLSKLLIDVNAMFELKVLMDHTNWDRCVSIVDRLSNFEEDILLRVESIHIAGKTFYSNEQKSYLNDSIRKKPSSKIITQWMSQPMRKYSVITADYVEHQINGDSWFSLNNANQFNNWSCNLGINYLYISRDGQISGTCKQKLFGLDYYYNIKDPEFKNKFSPKLKPVICQQTICMCAGEAALPKKKQCLKLTKCP
jgi:organic radical activating enzyme